MTHEDLEEAVPLYAAGALDRAERQALEAHLLSGCPSCHNALKEYQSVASLLPFGLSPMQPPRRLKASIMAARTSDPLAVDGLLKEHAKPSLEPGEWMNHLFPPIAPARSLSLPWAIGVASVLVLSVAGYVLWSYTARISDDAVKIRQLEAMVEEQSTKIARLNRDLGLRERSLAELQNDVQRRVNDATELKTQLIEREVELHPRAAQCSAARKGPSGRIRGVAPTS
jgi:hypothetical protein